MGKARIKINPVLIDKPRSSWEHIIDEYIRKLCKNNFINIQKIASMIIQNENKDIKHNNSDTKRLEHLRILLKNNDFSEEKEAEMLNKEYEMLLEKLNLGEQRK